MSTQCLICGDAVNEGRTVPYPGAAHSNTYPEHILLCPECGSGVADPMLSDAALSQLYEGAGYWNERDAVPIDRRNYPIPFGLAIARWKFLMPVLNKSAMTHGVSVLDVGAGHGCLGLVSRQFFEGGLARYSAVEPDPVMRHSLETAVRGSGLENLDTHETLDQVEGEFDLVVLSHVVEHVADPLAFLETVRRRIKPGGILFIEVPHQDHLFKMDVFPHLLFFTAMGMECLLKRCSMNVDSVSVWGRDMNRSPLKASKLCYQVLFERILSRISKIIPGGAAVAFYSWYYGMEQKHSNGTWLRAVSIKHQ